MSILISIEHSELDWKHPELRRRVYYPTTKSGCHLDQKLQGNDLATLIKDIHKDGMGFSSDKVLAGELYQNYGYLPYIGDRHTCEFFSCYITNKELMERFKLVRTFIKDREEMYKLAEERILLWTQGREADQPFDQNPSRETAADIIEAITNNHGFTDVVNMVNTGQIASLPYGAVVETMGYVDAGGFVPLVTGKLPDAINSIVYPHADVQLKIVESESNGDVDGMLMALIADPVCADLCPTDTKKMGLELIEANKAFM